MIRNTRLLVLSGLWIASIGCVGPLGSEGEVEGDKGRAASLRDPGATVWEVEHAWTDAYSEDETYEAHYETWLSYNVSDEFNEVMILLNDRVPIYAPELECADTAMFLRFLYAQQHGLPMAFRSHSGYFGHFGHIRSNGSRDTFERFPRDEQLGTNDLAIGTETFDEHLPNRFAQFLLVLVRSTFSGNVAEDWNTYYIGAEAVRGGDLIVRRYDADGTGHTITLQNVERDGEGLASSVDTIESSMPTPPFISQDDSVLMTLEPTPEFGGGLRRWRRPEITIRGGVRTIEMVVDPAAFVEAREAAEADDFMATMSPPAIRDQVLRGIEGARRDLFSSPSSCSRRVERERFFGVMYDLFEANEALRASVGLTDSNPTRRQVVDAVDLQYRYIDDFIWARLDYDRSRTCHWNPNPMLYAAYADGFEDVATINTRMYQVAISTSLDRLERANCQALRVFRAEGAQYCAARDSHPGRAQPNIGEGPCAGLDDGFLEFRGVAAQWALPFAPFVVDEAGLEPRATDPLYDPDRIDRFCELVDMGLSTDPWPGSGTVFFAPDLEE